MGRANTARTLNISQSADLLDAWRHGGLAARIARVRPLPLSRERARGICARSEALAHQLSERPVTSRSNIPDRSTASSIGTQTLHASLLDLIEDTIIIIRYNNLLHDASPSVQVNSYQGRFVTIVVA